MKLFLYDLLFLIAFILYLPVFIVKLVRRGGVSHHFSERFGLYSRGQKRGLRELDRPVWIHACSVGEVVAAVSFIRRWRERDPELHFVLSCTTTTGHATAAKKLPDGVGLVYCPLDFSFPVRRALRIIRPRLLVIFEVEVWPNLISLAANTGAPVVLANGRMSDKSSQGYARHGWFFRDLFDRFAVICVQSEEDATRVRRVVDDRVPVHVCNTMKFDQAPDVTGVDKTALLDQAFGRGERLVWTAGSTHPAEEALVADAFKRLKEQFPALKLVLVPRHHERTAEVEKILVERDLPYRLLAPKEGASPTDGTVDILLVNTTGELMNFYASSDVVFVGKSLAGAEGGHNIIEPAIFGKPIVHGPAMQNFRAVARIFRNADATVQAESDAELAPAVGELLGDQDKRGELGRRAREVVETWRGAVDRTLDCFEPLLTAADLRDATPAKTGD